MKTCKECMFAQSEVWISATRHPPDVFFQCMKTNNNINSNDIACENFIQADSPTYVYRHPSKESSTKKLKQTFTYGWVCPKCGRVLSPNMSICPCSDKWEVTC